jgi:Bacteriophage tail sheath protein
MSAPHMSPSPWPQVSASGLVDRIGRDLRESLAWTSAQPNGETLWRAVRVQAEALLTDLWREGTLVGTTAREAFFVRCDATTMSRADIDLGRLVLVVGVATVRPAEFEPIQVDRQVGPPLRRSRREE